MRPQRQSLRRALFGRACLEPWLQPLRRRALHRRRGQHDLYGNRLRPFHLRPQAKLTLRADGQVTRFRAASGEEADLVECAKPSFHNDGGRFRRRAAVSSTGLQTDGAETVCTFDYYLNGIPRLPPWRPRRGNPLLGRVHRAGEAPSAHVYAHDPDRLRSPARAGRQFCRTAVSWGSSTAIPPPA